MSEQIILIGEVITALFTIGSVVGIMWKLFKKINDFEETLNYNTVTILKLLIINENIPLDERVIAGQKYLALGGNGAIKKLVEKLTEELANDYIE